MRDYLFQVSALGRGLQCVVVCSEVSFAEYRLFYRALLQKRRIILKRLREYLFQVSALCRVLQCVVVCCSVLQCVAVCCTGWRRPIGCLISEITFRKLATNYRALLRKMTYTDKASYDSTPPSSVLRG